MAYRLANAQSAYLRQHARNPVDWWPWGAEAFEEARHRDVPVFVSIGYAACHWCHVMAGESFQDDDVAAVLNERFLSIKVDREEHPDVDDAYMAATQAMTGQGGWPMSVFTLPDGRVFHAGTYFPPRPMGQVPAFTQVLDAVHEAWTQRRDQVQAQAAKIAEALHGQRRHQAQLATTVQTDHPSGGPVLERTQLESLTGQALQALAEQEDTAHGGFGTAPKFPPSPALGWLLEEAAWHPDSPAAGLAVRTMAAMARSALFDQVEGGFARYATDRAWALPHFEKMHYDNAQLLGHYARLSAHPAAEESQRTDARRIAEATISWLRHRMLLDSGLLASSLDADTAYPDGTHVEGGTYLFSDAELRDAALTAGLTETEAADVVVLNRGVPADEHAVRSGAPVYAAEHAPRTLHFATPLTAEQRRLWEQVVPRLRRRRSSRPQPARDEKVVAAWNAQTVTSLAQAAALWDDQATREFAVAIAEQLWQIHVESDDDARVHRTSYDGVRGERLGTLADHAHLATMCFALVSSGADPGWLDRGTAVLRFITGNFVIDDGDGWALAESLDDDGTLTAAQGGAAHATPFDGPEPSSVAALAQALQTAEALERIEHLPPVLADEQPLRASDLLHHLAVTAPKAPIAVGASLLAGRRVAQGSPAFRVVQASPEDLAQVRRAGALYGIPVEPVAPGAVVADAALGLSVCLNAPGTMVCLPPVGSLQAALAQL